MEAGDRNEEGAERSAQDDRTRAMHDAHAQDEALHRAHQQVAAGGSHSPVEPYPALGASPPGSAITDDRLVAEYEAASAAESAAWLAVKTESDPARLAAWSDWRRAVELRERATRLLINRALAQFPRKADTGQG
jgi:hypothetical protein